MERVIRIGSRGRLVLAQAGQVAEELVRLGVMNEYEFVIKTMEIAFRIAQ